MDGEIDTALAAWAREPSLAALRAPDGAYLVLDQDGRVLHASRAARAAAEALIDAPSLARQIAWPAAAGTARRLARLRLDARRIAPPTLCLVAHGARDGGAPLILVVPTGPPAAPRASPRPAETAPSAPQRPEPGPAPAAHDRFVWRSDATGALTALTGADGLTQLSTPLLGRSWEQLAEAGIVSGAAAMLSALGARRTFRAEPLNLDLGRGPVPVELSGAPLGRGEAAFTGFGGFGLVRGIPSPAAHPGIAAPAETPPSGGGTPSPREARIAAEPDPDAAASAVPDAAASEPPAPAAPDPALSTDEHAAFREIARALGARYAGDEMSAEPRPRAEGAVMPFPGPQAAVSEATAPAEPVGDGLAVLAGLPLPALLHRGGAILAANRSLLDLTGHADLAALSAAGLDRLFRGLPPADPRPGAWRTAIEAADGHPIPVEVLSGNCAWDGAGATCSILRPLGAEDSAASFAAERLAREAQAARAADAEAALDALPTGVVALDRAGRVTALNRAAAELFGCDPREVVGGPLAALFDASEAAALADLPSGQAAPRAASAGGRPLTVALSPPRADGRRIALVERAPPEARLPESTDAEDEAVQQRSGAGPRASGGVLDRLDRALHAPAAGIVALTEAMLCEPYGPLGDGRYRAGLGEIREAGERMLERATELSDLAAVEAGALDLDPRPLALNDVAASCIARLQPEAARGRIVMRTSFSADLAELEADERSVSRAARLVIEHAIRRSPAGGQVIVSTGADGGAGVALRVRDTGPGPARPEPASDRDADLALPRALVEANGGRLRLSGRAEEDGTLVEIILPLRRAG